MMDRLIVRNFLLVAALTTSLAVGGCNLSLGKTERHETNKHTTTTKIIYRDSASFESKTIPMESMAADPAMVDLMAPYAAEVKKLETPIATASATMEVVRRECPLGSWITDALLKQTAIKTGQSIDFALLNSGGVRATLPAGPVSYITINNILPFDNTVTVLDLTGEQVTSLVTKLAEKKGRYLIAGLTVEADADGKLISYTIQGAAPDPARLYKMATINYLSEGNDGFTEFPTYPTVDTEIFLRDIIADYVLALTAAGRTIDPPANPWNYRFAGKTVEEIN